MIGRARRGPGLANPLALKITREHEAMLDAMIGLLGPITREQALLAMALYDWTGLCNKRYRRTRADTDKALARDLSQIRMNGSH